MSSLVLIETLGSRSALVTLIRGKIAAAVVAVVVVVAGIIRTRTLRDQKHKFGKLLGDNINLSGRS